MKAQSLLQLCLILLVTSCGNIREGHIIANNARSINLDSGASTISFAQAVNVERVINLETTDKSVISEAMSIGKVLSEEGKYLILDAKFMAVKAFDSSGRFLYNFGNPGLGRGQFLNVQDMVYDPGNHSLLVLCNTPSKVSEFSLDGKWIADTKLNFYASRIAIEPDGRRIFFVNQNESEVSDKKNILVTDEKYNVISRYFDFPKKLRASVKFSGGLWGTGNEIYFNSPFSNVYYRLSGDTAVPAFAINYGRRTIADAGSGTSVSPNPKFFNYQMNTFCKCGDYIGFNYMNKRVSVAFFNERSGAVIANDIKADSLNILFYNLVFETENKLIMILDVNGMRNFYQRNSTLIREKLPAIYDQLAFEKHQNPSLMIFKLKNL